MNLESRIKTFITLGKVLSAAGNNLSEADDVSAEWIAALREKADTAHFENPWFTETNVLLSYKALGFMLEGNKVEHWLAPYHLTSENKNPKRIAVIMAGNIPLAGFHDMLCILITGNKFLGKPSERDGGLMKTLVEILCSIEPAFSDRIEFSDGRMDHFDAVIASGSNNTGRYFEYYFGKYPHIIRKHRNSVAVLDGNETDEEIVALANDIFTYFGMGCRNVSKLFVPEGYSFNRFFELIEPWNFLYRHNKYANNYDYHQSVYLMNRIPFLDNGFTLLKDDHEIYSPLAVIFYEYYSDIAILAANMENRMDSIQCIVGHTKAFSNEVRFGTAQSPDLQEYADKVDTIDFLNRL